ncbi:MAG: SPFH domain-containing protein [Firmicutes bacterium]|nr:SPFH domain-containing protein [Bacillota bacterium]
MEPIRESKAWYINGFVMLFLQIAVNVLCVWVIIRAAMEQDVAWPGRFWYAIIVLVVASLLWSGFFVVQPNTARVIVFFGRYVGSVRQSGFWWTNPFTQKPLVSLRIHNFNSEKLKVNDALGNPIEIAAVVVWRVVDSAKALLDVENYQEFVATQSETAIRTLATRYPYDSHREGEESLRGNPDDIARELKNEVQARLEVAGVEVLEARISHLAYAPEIAQAMLRRQQAEAIIAARQRIVEGAVGMVEMALQQLSEHNVVELDEERKAAMVNNLLVALVSESEATPVINTGTLYA